MGEYRTLYLDMNSFFASVEQQLDPRLRGRPVAITATENDSGACVAASYEAKAFGVKTGTLVRDARRLCPGITFLPSRHRLYVRYNLAVAAVLDRHAELERIRSIDEFQLALSGPATEVEGAIALVKTLKAAVAAEVGECLKFSAGFGPNHLLAKIAGKLEKPDGCRWLGSENMPHAIAHLALDDLPGISSNMRVRLERAGVRDIEALCRLDPRHARAIWNSVEGERFVRALQCQEIPLHETQRGGFGNSKVLAPEFRGVKEAYLVSRWLIDKSTGRLRRDGRVAAKFSVSMTTEQGYSWGRSVKLAPSQDTMTFLRINREIWRAAWPALRGRRLASVGVNLTDVSLLQERTGDLFRPLRPAEKSSLEKASAAMDFINARFGDGTIRIGERIEHPGFFERG